MNKVLRNALLGLAFVVFSLQMGLAQPVVAKMYNTHNITLALMGVPSASGYYYKTGVNGLCLRQISATTYQLTGKIQNLNNPSERWAVDFTLNNKQMGDIWMQWGHMIQSDVNGCNPQNPADIAMFEIQSGTSVLIGEGAFAGKSLSLYNIDYGSGPKMNQAQFGDKASVINCGDGAALWFAFQGSYSGTADFYASATVDPNLVAQPGPPCSFVNTNNITLGIFGIPGQANEYYLPGAAGVKIYPESANLLRVEGEIVNQLNPAQRFMVRYYLTNPKTYADWIASGEMVMSNPAGCTTGNTSTWTIWEIESGTSILQGMGANAGINLSVYEMPLGGGMVKKNFAQIGDGAAVINCGPGIAMWYAFQGTYTGTSDFFASTDCPNGGNFVNRCEVTKAQYTSGVINIKNQTLGNRRYLPDGNGVRFITYPDGTADIKGRVVSITNPNDFWDMYIPMSDPKSYAAWLGNTHTNCATADVNSWLIYSMGTGTMIGGGTNAGQSLNVTVAPGYGVQLGEGGSGKCGNGIGTWIRYSGSFKAKGDIHMAITPGTCQFTPCGGAGQPGCTASTNNNLVVNEDAMFANANTLREGELMVFPNPVFGEEINFVVSDFDATNAKLVIADLSGRIIFETTADVVAGEASSIDVNQLPIGSYVITLITEDHAPMTALFTKR